MFIIKLNCIYTSLSLKTNAVIEIRDKSEEGYIIIPPPSPLPRKFRGHAPFPPPQAL